MSIAHRFLSVGKSDRRNDDFGFAVDLFSYQVIGVLGDFTSDSPQGSAEACSKRLRAFIQERLPKWRDMLLPAERLLPLLVRHVDEWLREDEGRPRTTLIVLLWDVRVGICRYISIGDSGLGVVGSDGVRFLREGDRQGLRVAAGFLPGSHDVTVQAAPVAKDEVLFAFSDGFWENTHTFMNEAVLRDAFRGSSAEAVAQRVDAVIIKPAMRTDDLSILLFRGTDMDVTHPDRVGLDPDALSKLVADTVDRRLELAVGQGRLAADASPFEQELARLLGDAPALEQQLLNRLLPRLSDELGAQLSRRMAEGDAERKQLLEANRALVKRLDAQQEDLAALQDVVKAGKAASPRRAGGTSKPEGAVQKPIGRGVVKGRRDIALKDQMTEALQNPWAVAGLTAVTVVLLGLLVWAIWPSGSDQRPTTPVEVPASGIAPTGERGDKVPDREEPLVETGPATPAQRGDVPAVTAALPVAVPAGFLSCLDSDEAAFAAEVRAVHTALTQLPTIVLPSTELMRLTDAPRLNNGLISLELTGNSTWINQKPVPVEMAARIWLQARLAVSVDGLPGSGTREVFVKRAGEVVARGNRLAKALAGTDKPAMDQALATYAESYSQAALATELMQLAEQVHQKGPGSDALAVSLSRGGKTTGIQARLRTGEGFTALGRWLEDVRTKSALQATDLDTAVRVLWLGHYLGLPSSDGDAAGPTLHAAVPYAGKDAAGLFDEAVAGWKVRP